MIIYRVTATVRVGVNPVGVQELVRAFDLKSTHWREDRQVIAIVPDRSAAKDLSWLLLVSRDVEHVSVRDEDYSQDPIGS